MAVTTTNLIAGPATLYSAEFGATEPADTAVATAPSGFTDVGGTRDGVYLNINQEFFELEVDQIVDVPGRVATKRDMRIRTSMAEPTLENLKLALNGGTISTGEGYEAYDPAMDIGATQPTFSALILDGYAPDTKRRRVIARRVLSVEPVETAAKKDEQTVFPVEFACHWVSASVKPFRVIDEVEAA